MKKNLFQKLMCISISMFMLIAPLAGNVSAAQSNKNLYHETDSGTKFVFDKSEYEGMSELEAGIKKVNEYGLGSNAAKNMDEEILKDIGRSQYMKSEIVYLVEDEDMLQSEGFYNLSEGFYNLSEVDEEEYNNLLALKRNDIIDKLKSNVTVIDENGNQIPNINPLAENETSRNIDSGKVRMLLRSFHYTDSKNNYYYQVLNEFIWDTMPEGRGTDIFGITRSNNTSYFPGSGEGSYEYIYLRYGGYAAASGWNPILISDDIIDVPCRNDDTSGVASAIRIDMPKDVIPFSVIAGNYYEAKIYPSLAGAAWYKGTLDQIVAPSINNINHWGTLEHQTRGKLSLTPSLGVSYPLNAAFTIDSSYEKQFTSVSISILNTIQVQ